MSNYQLYKQMRNLRSEVNRLKPDESWISETRSTLLMQVKNSLPDGEKIQRASFKANIKFISPFISFNWLRKPAFAITSIIVTLFGGSLLSVSAAEQSLPGDFLYSIKLATEQARLAMVKTPQDRVILKTEFTERRVNEMKRVASVDTPDRKQLVIQTAETIKRDLHTLKDQLDEVKQNSSPQTIKETAQIVDQKSAAVMQSLQDSKGSLSPEEKIKVTEAQAAASDTSVKAIEVLVDAHTQDSAVVTDADVKDVLKQHNDTVSKTVSQSTGVDMMNASSTTIFAGTTTSSPLADLTSTSTVAQVLEKITQAKQSLDQADQLVSEQKMDEAVAKIKLGTQQAFAVQKTIEQTQLNNANADAATAANPFGEKPANVTPATTTNTGTSTPNIIQKPTSTPRTTTTTQIPK